MVASESPSLPAPLPEAGRGEPVVICVDTTKYPLEGAVRYTVEKFQPRGGRVPEPSFGTFVVDEEWFRMSVVFLVRSEEELRSGAPWCAVFAEAMDSPIVPVVLGADRKVLEKYAESALEKRFRRQNDGKTDVQTVEPSTDDVLELCRNVRCRLLVIIHSEITSLWFLKKIALMLETPVESENKIDIITAVYHRLLDLTNQNKKIVIFIDEANMLQKKPIMEEIRGLLNLESERGKLLNFILFGLPEMEDYLKLDPPLYQRIAVRCVLEPLDENATYNYIVHRLRVAGCTKPLFTKEALQNIYLYSKGIPRTINAICDNALLEGFLLKKDIVDQRIINDVSQDLGFAAGQG